MPHLEPQEVLNLRKDLLDTWSAAHDQWRNTCEPLWDGLHKIRYMKPAEPRRLSSGRAKVNAFTDTMMTIKPVVRREAVREGLEHEKHRDKVEKWAVGVLTESIITEMVPPFHAMAKFLGALGYAVLSVKWDSQRWPKKPRRNATKERHEEYERKRLVAFPFRIEAPHPARVLMPSEERVPSMAIETYTLRAFQVEKLFPALGAYHGRPYDLLEVVEHWDDDDHEILVDGLEAFSADNAWGFVPYTHALDGAGLEHAPTYGAGLTGTGPKGPGQQAGFGPRPEHQAQGLLLPVKDAIISLDEFFTGRLNQALQNAYRVRLIGAGEDAEEVAQMFQDAGLGGFVPVDKAKIGWEEPPRTDPQDLAVMDLARRDIEVGTFSGVVQGFRDPGVTTATQHAQQLGESRQKFAIPMKQVNTMAEIALGMMARMQTVRGEELTVNGVTVGPDDFEDNYKFSVAFESRDEAQRARERAVGMEEVKTGLNDPESYWEATGVEDAVERQRRVIVSRARNSPRYLEQVMSVAEQLAQAKLAKRGVLIPPLQSEPIGMNGQGQSPSAEGPPTPFVTMPGSPQEAQQVGQGMEQAGMGPDMTRAGA